MMKSRPQLFLTNFKTFYNLVNISTHQHRWTEKTNTVGSIAVCAVCAVGRHSWWRTRDNRVIKHNTIYVTKLHKMFQTFFLFSNGAIHLVNIYQIKYTFLMLCLLGRIQSKLLSLNVLIVWEKQKTAIK